MYDDSEEMELDGQGEHASTSEDHAENDTGTTKTVL